MKATNGVLRELSQNCGSQWITFRHGHQVDFAAILGGGELSELARKVLTNADHEVFLTGFQFLCHLSRRLSDRQRRQLRVG